MIGAIESEINRIQKNKTIQISFTNQSVESQKLSNDVQIVLYRIFQEIVNNVLKHAKATEIEIIVKSNPKFEMKIKDNGIGFDGKAAKTNSNSLGLQNLVQRAEIIDYSIQFLSEINQGCTVIVLEN